MAESSSSGSTGIVAIVAIVLLVLMGFFVFRGGLFRSGGGGGNSPGIKGNVEIKTPSTPAPSTPAPGGQR
jgi:hypothetical protein